MSSPTAPSHNKASPRVMLIDDEQDIARAMTMALSKAGFNVDAFTDPLEALRHFKPRTYKLIIIDIKMPLMDGFTFYRHARRVEPEVKVCFMTALSAEALIHEDLSEIPRVCLAKKPIHTQELVMLLRAELNASNDPTVRSPKKSLSASG